MTSLNWNSGIGVEIRIWPNIIRVKIFNNSEERVENLACNFLQPTACHVMNNGTPQHIEVGKMATFYYPYSAELPSQVRVSIGATIKKRLLWERYETLPECALASLLYPRTFLPVLADWHRVEISLIHKRKATFYQILNTLYPDLTSAGTPPDGAGGRVKINLHPLLYLRERGSYAEIWSPDQEELHMLQRFGSFSGDFGWSEEGRALVKLGEAVGRMDVCMFEGMKKVILIGLTDSASDCLRLLNLPFSFETLRDRLVSLETPELEAEDIALLEENIDEFYEFMGGAKIHG